MTALVVTGFGLNCEEESLAAYRKASAPARIVHAADLFSGSLSLRDASIVHLSGGFSFGDDLGSGRVFANRMRLGRLPSGSTVLRELAAFVADGGLVFGVCNGFQILVRAGLLPNLGGTFEAEVTLAHNDSGRFEDRWVSCVAGPSPTTAFRGAPRFDLPVRHGEGKLVTRDDDVRDELVRQRLVALQYADASGAQQAYPANPNGSALACAALTDPTGRVVGAMPHPEAYLRPELHPAWPTRAPRDGERDGDSNANHEADGLRVFQNLVAAARASGRLKDSPP